MSILSLSPSAVPFASKSVPPASRSIAPSPERISQKGRYDPPEEKPTVTVDAVAVCKFLRNAMPTADRFAVDIDVALVESVTVRLFMPTLLIEAVAPESAIELSR